MLVLLAIGFAAGVITAVSPCVLPVLPVILAGGATGSGRRPLAIMAGLVASFTLFTLTAAALLSALGLPQDCSGRSSASGSSARSRS
jgi:cytochrome c biogenesis protein CcdA